MVLSALQSTNWRWNADCGTIRLLFPADFAAADLITVTANLASKDAAALAFGLTEAGMGPRDWLVCRVAGRLLYDGIGIRFAFL